MRDPWLFWVGLACIPFAGICFLLAVRATSPRRELVLGLAARVIGGAAALVIGYESAFRTGAGSIAEAKVNTAVGLCLLTAGLVWVGEGAARAFKRSRMHSE
jgi:hypothetical protein